MTLARLGDAPTDPSKGPSGQHLSVYGRLLFFVAFLTIWIPSGVCAGNVAKDKGHRFSDWAWAGFLFGPIGLLGAVGLSDNKLRRIAGLIAMDQGITKETVVSCYLNPDAWAKRQGEVAASDQAKDLIKKTRGRWFRNCCHHETTLARLGDVSSQPFQRRWRYALLLQHT